MFGLVPMKKLEHDMMESPFSKMFDWTDDFMAPMWGSSNVFKVDVRDNGDSYELEADMPGLTKDNISMSYTDNYLTISAKKEDANDEKDDNGNYIRRERSTGSMSRSFYIDDVDASKLQQWCVACEYAKTGRGAKSVRNRDKVTIKSG